MESIVENVISSTKKKVEWEDGNKLKEKLESIGKSDIKMYKRQLIIAVKSSSSNSTSIITAMFNAYPYHAAPLALNTATNIVLRAMKPSAKYRIQVTSHPWVPPKTKSSSARSDTSPSRRNQDDNSSQPVANLKPCKDSIEIIDYVVYIGMFLLLLAFMLFTSFFIIGPIEEKVCNVKQLQLMTGLQPAMFWGTHFIWDYTLYFIMVILTLTFLGVAELSGYIFLSVVEGAGVLFLILMCYGFSSISLAYLLSLRSSTVAGGFALLVAIHLLFGTIFGYPLAIFSDSSPAPHILAKILFYLIVLPVKILAYCFPDLAALTALFRFVKIAAANMICYYENIEYARLNKPHRNIYQSYLKWSHTKYIIGNNEIVEVTTRGVGQELFFLVLVGVVYVIWLMVSEYKVCRRIFGRESPPPFPPNIYDDDVYQEADRVNYVVHSGKWLFIRLV